MKAYRILVIAMMCVLVSSIALAGTQVFSIEADPDNFNPIETETTTNRVEATSGVASLEVRVLSFDYSKLIRSGLTEFGLAFCS